MKPLGSRVATTHVHTQAASTRITALRLRRYSTYDLPPVDCVRFEDIVRAHHRIRSGIVRTPCERSHWLSKETGSNIFLKTEQQQFTGSFKERGARNAIMSLSLEQRSQGVIAASAGNHALALAWHGPMLGVPVTVVMPTVAPMTKVRLDDGSV